MRRKYPDDGLMAALQTRRPLPDARNPIHGAVIGVVTNNTDAEWHLDPTSRGRVKVRFPWLHDTVESHWARIAQPYAGNGRGTYWIPEVGDEVCVIFDRGDINHPYILGGIWNGPDVPPPPGNPDGKDDTKLWQTRNGHKIVFEDHPAGERITLTDGPGSRHLVIDVVQDTITLTASPGDITFEAPQESIKFECVDLEIDVHRDSTWTHDTTRSDHCTDRVETITGPDVLQIGQSWNIVTKNAAVAPQQSRTTLEKAGNLVTGDLRLAGDRRDLTSTTIKRLSAPEQTQAAKVEAKVDDTFTHMVDGIAEIHFDEQTIDAKDVMFAAAKTNEMQGGDIKVEGKSAVTMRAKKIELGPGGPTQPEMVEDRKKDWIEIRLVDHEGEPVANEKYRLKLPDGTVKEGTLDSQGKARVDGVLPGSAEVRFPELQQPWQRKG
ncbi:MAG: hypothetical protein H6701_03020 [Myxococcales bacterium]|nr:hypothetical protein [Myxococcales bacterium]